MKVRSRSAIRIQARRQGFSIASPIQRKARESRKANSGYPPDTPPNVLNILDKMDRWTRSSFTSLNPPR